MHTNLYKSHSWEYKLCRVGPVGWSLLRNQNARQCTHWRWRCQENGRWAGRRQRSGTGHHLSWPCGQDWCAGVHTCYFLLICSGHTPCTLLWTPGVHGPLAPNLLPPHPRFPQFCHYISHCRFVVQREMEKKVMNIVHWLFFWDWKNMSQKLRRDKVLSYSKII